MAIDLRLDIETYCELDLMDVGVYKYVEHPSFEILMIGYSYDDGPKEIIDLYEQDNSQRLKRLVRHLQDPEYLKKAFNANFEITALSKYFNIDLDATQWRCTMVLSLYNGLPGSLDAAAKALGLAEKKDTKGKALINYFSKPCKPTKTNGYRARNMPWDASEKWAEFKEYCMQDVVVEHAVESKISRNPVPDSEWRLWVLDQEINKTGVAVDMDIVNGAVALSEEYTTRLISEAIKLTGIENPNSLPQLKAWIEENEGIEVTSLDKDAVKDLIQQGISNTTLRLLRIRQELGMTSVSKYLAMQRSVCADGRIRGLFRFYKANRTGRWAGALVQLQNLTKHKMKDVEAARDVVKMADLELVEMLYGNVQSLLSQLVRTALISPECYDLTVSDLSAIEARVIAWVAEELWRLEVFNGHGKIYEASATQMFKVPIETIVEGHENHALRAKGKVAELALGYQGGPGALRTMDKKWAASASEEELKALVIAWRAANPKIVKLWKTIEQYAMQAIRTGKTLNFKHGIAFSYQRGNLYMHLPSGRKLCYQRARIEPHPTFNGDQIIYWGEQQDQDKKTKGWQKLSTYGGKLTENLIQAIARDVIAEIMLRLDERGYLITMHVHDEVVVEALKGSVTEEEVVELMREPIAWAPGLPLNAAAFKSEYYKKD